MEEDHRKIKEIVPKKFLKWRKVFGKVESERMLMRKVSLGSCHRSQGGV